jgi:hypothetical protein
MILPTRSSIQRQKNEQLKAELDTAVVLTTKVNALHEELLNLERDRRLFIEAEERRFHTVIDTLSVQKDELDKKIKDRKTELEKLLRPLDDEWKKVKEEQEKIKKIKDELLEEINQWGIIKENITFIQQNNVLESKKILKKTLEAEKLLFQASKDKENAKKILSEATNRAENILSKCAEKLSEIVNRETLLKNREIDTENKIKSALDREKANKKESLHIATQQRTLSASFRELKKQHG